MGELIIYLVPVVIGAVVFRFLGNKRREKRIALINETAQKNGWIDVSHLATESLQTLRDFRLLRRGTRTNVANMLMINEQDRLFILKHGSMTNNVTYSYIVFFRKLKSRQYPEINIGLKQHDRARTVPENRTIIQSDRLGLLNTHHNVESRKSEVSQALNMLSPDSLSMFGAIGVNEKRPEMEVKQLCLLLYRPQLSEESSETIEQFVRQAQGFAQKVRMI